VWDEIPAIEHARNQRAGRMPNLNDQNAGAVPNSSAAQHQLER